MTREQARRLWRMLPTMALALVEVGPDLVDAFVARGALLERARRAAGGRGEWLARLEAFAGRLPAGHAMTAPQQSDLFDQVARVMQRLARQAPLLLIMDDLQWADLGSIRLLFHLGRHLAGSRILIVGAYRAEEVAIGRGDERHPLEPMVHELQRLFGDNAVDLDQVEGRAFVDAILNSEPNRLGPSFRELLYRQTGGHPLFTVELLRGLQERGDLLRDAEGRWVEGDTLNWERLPARVEAVVAERIGRLAPPLRAALRVASVEGEQFTAEVVARVRAMDEQELLSSLSRELDRRHRLVRARSITRLQGQCLSRYRFQHIFFQRYLYNSLDEVERVHLHEQVANALEALFGSQEEALLGADVAVQLALHFRKAGIPGKAIHYLLLAGRRAARLSAYQEGIAHLNHGLALLTTLPASVERDRQELDLQLALGLALEGAKGIPAPEVVKAYSRAQELSQRVGSAATRCRVLGQLSVYHYVVADQRKALLLAREALRVAEEADDPLHVALGHWYLGIAFFALGDYAAAGLHLRETVAYYQPETHHLSFITARGTDAGTGAMAYGACCLWCLGYPDQALQRSQEALALAHQLGHGFSLADVLCYGGCLPNTLLGDPHAVQASAAELIQVARDLPSWKGNGMGYLAAALILLGRHEEGIATLRRAMAELQAYGVRCDLVGNLLFLVRGLMGVRQIEEAVATLAEAMAALEETGQRHWEAEAWRLKGELSLAQGDPAAAEAHLRQAIQVARRQQARSWELRAAISLCRLWRAEDRALEARQTLAQIYGWFTEGFDTPDLVEARLLLAELGETIP
jgi:tetratricopeptide (TPR) repeat protein